MARSWECTEQYAQKVLDTAGILRDAILRQLLLDRASQNRSMARGRLSSMCRSSPQLLPPYPSLTTP
jgi:hypothetical protein